MSMNSHYGLLAPERLETAMYYTAQTAQAGALADLTIAEAILEFPLFFVRRKSHSSVQNRVASLDDEAHDVFVVMEETLHAYKFTTGIILLEHKRISIGGDDYLWWEIESVDQGGGGLQPELVCKRTVI